MLRTIVIVTFGYIELFFIRRLIIGTYAAQRAESLFYSETIGFLVGEVKILLFVSFVAIVSVYFANKLVHHLALGNEKISFLLGLGFSSSIIFIVAMLIKRTVFDIT